jgi:membrane fusion protein (multidrug efflux system)
MTRYFLLAALAASLAACSSNKADSAQTTEAAAPAEPTYATMQVARHTSRQELRLPGELLPHFEVALYAKVNGFVKSVSADVGDRVRKGQVLARMEAPEMAADLSRAQAEIQAAKGKLKVSQITYKRLRQTARTAGAVAPQELDLARANVQADSIALLGKYQLAAGSRQMNSYLTLTAPFDGIVTERLLSPGALVGPAEKDAQPIIKLKEVDLLRLQVVVPEAYAGQLHENAPITFTVNAFPGQQFAGKINRVSHNVERAVRGEMVEIEVKNPGLKLAPGMYASVELPVHRDEKSLFVPKTALVVSMENSYVIAVRDGKTHRVPVQAGADAGSEIEVTGADLLPTDQVIARASDDIADGIAVHTTAAKPDESVAAK